MNLKQATRINDHLISAYDAMDKARMAIAGLGKEERLRFDEALHEIKLDLEEKLLLPIYDQFPDLCELEVREPLEVSSELTWNEVSLPSTVTEADLDQVIMPLLTSRWQKVAVVLTRVKKRCEELGLPIDYEVIAARLRFLSDSDRIEGVGDLRFWTGSEVWLKD